MTEFYSEQMSPEQINTAFIDKLDRGLIKEAEEAGSTYIRQRMYEEGLLRRMHAPKLISASELDPEENTDKPSILVEIEPDATKATFVPYKGTADHRYFDGKRYRLYFGKIESDRLTKSKFELMTSRMDIMTWLQKNQVYSTQFEEDGRFLQLCEKIITDSGTEQTTEAGAQDTFIDAFNIGLKGLVSYKLPCGCVMMNKNTYIDSSKLKVEDIGVSPQEKRFSNGVEGEETFRGMKVITTMDSALIPEDVLWFFAQPDYLFKHYTLQDATLYLKTEADMITFHTYSAPGVGIGNTRGIFKVTLP
jgi:hypothetical protein